MYNYYLFMYCHNKLVVRNLLGELIKPNNLFDNNSLLLIKIIIIININNYFDYLICLWSVKLALIIIGIAS